MIDIARSLTIVRWNFQLVWAKAITEDIMGGDEQLDPAQVLGTFTVNDFDILCALSHVLELTTLHNLVAELDVDADAPLVLHISNPSMGSTEEIDGLTEPPICIDLGPNGLGFIVTYQEY